MRKAYAVLLHLSFVARQPRNSVAVEIVNTDVPVVLRYSQQVLAGRNRQPANSINHHLSIITMRAASTHLSIITMRAASTHLSIITMLLLMSNVEKRPRVVLSQTKSWVKWCRHQNIKVTHGIGIKLSKYQSIERPDGYSSISGLIRPLNFLGNLNFFFSNIVACFSLDELDLRDNCRVSNTLPVSL